jgi:hypothetical protein
VPNRGKRYGRSVLTAVPPASMTTSDPSCLWERCLTTDSVIVESVSALWHLEARNRAQSATRSQSGAVGRLH